MQDIQQCIEHIAASARPLAARGRLADYIPALREVDPWKFGMAVATLDGGLYATGDADEPFSIQSISKLFALVFALRLVGDGLWERVGRLPSSSSFNSLIELEEELGRPRNPYLNAGALVVSDLLSSRNTQMELAVLDLVRKLAANPAIVYDRRVAASEFECAHRNKAAAHLMKSFGNFHNSVDAVVSAYSSQCAIAAGCKDLAAAALFLANGGIDRDGRQVLEPRQVHQVCALMMSSGTYEASGETAFTIGLPIKSGVGGGVLAVVPGFGTVCAWSPPLDATGTSAAGLKAVELFALAMKKTVFA